MKKRVLSGIRATGRLHLGNYLGAVKGMLELQDNPVYETFYMVADVHAVTTPYNVEELRKNRREVIIDYLAVGLDPQKSVLFLQADVPELCRYQKRHRSMFWMLLYFFFKCRQMLHFGNGRNR